MLCELMTEIVLSDFCSDLRSASQLQSPCFCTEIAENHLKPGLKPKALNLCKPPSANVTGLTLLCCFTESLDL